jgi:hypothetical protein
MKKIYSLICLSKAKFVLSTLIFIISIGSMYGQSTVNYPMTTNATSSLDADLNGNTIGIGTGTTQIVAPAQDATVSAVTPIGFTFFFMGLPYSSFSVSADGLMGLGTTALTSSTLTVGSGSTTTPRLGACVADLYVGSSGKVHYKLVGTAPNRCLVVEWTNMAITYTTTAASANSTYQIRLYESTGIVQYVYGFMNCTGTTYNPIYVGFSSGALVNQVTSVAYSTTTASTSATLTSNTLVVGNIPNMHSTANGSRRAFVFTPLVPVASPTALNFTNIAPGSMTLNWTPSSPTTNILKYNIYLSSNGGTTYSFLGQTASAASSTIGITGLTPSTLYYFNIVPVSEGAEGTALNGSQSTSACPASFPATIPINGATSVSGTSYQTLTAALAELKSCGITQPTILEIQTGYNPALESTGGIVLDSVPGSSATNTITIRQASTVSGTVITTASGGGTFWFNRGKYYIIDGRSGGSGSSKQMTIANSLSNSTNIGAAAYFVNESSNNVIKYCVLKSLTFATTTATVYFGGSTVPPISNGNDNNRIDSNDIDGGAGATASPTTTALNGIYSSGTTTTTATNNSGNIISNNRIFDYFGAALASNGILIAGGSTDWTISGNSIYQSSTRTSTAGSNNIGININNTSGNNFLVTGNTIGGSAINAGGTAWTVNGAFANRFRGISVACGTTTFSKVQNNSIKNINFTANSSATTVGGQFCGIYQSAGSALISNNLVGDSTVASSISLSAITTASGLSSGIWIDGGTLDTISNNKISSIALTGGTTSIGHGFTGIHLATTTTAIDVLNNNIGSASNSISSNNIVAAAIVQVVRGINNVSSSIIRIKGNTIRNLNNAGTGTGTQVIGIVTSSGTDTISGNTIRTLATPGTVSPGVIGILSSTITSGVVITKNSISDLLASGAFTTSAVRGIQLSSNTGTPLIAYNMIQDLRCPAANGNAMTIGIDIAASATQTRLYNNTVAIGYPTVAAGTTNFGVIGVNYIASTNLDFRNNLIYINATRLGTGTNVGLRKVTGTALTPPTSSDFQNSSSNNVYTLNAADYNYVYGEGTPTTTAIVNAFSTFSGATLSTPLNVKYDAGFNSNCSLYKSFLGSGRESASFNETQTFTGGATIPNNLIPAPAGNSYTLNGGQAIAGLITDFFGAAVSGSTPDIGAAEFATGTAYTSDVTSPSISFIGSNSSSMCLSAYKFKAIIKDNTGGSGLNTTAGTAPRLWFKKSTETSALPVLNNSTENAWKYTEGVRVNTSDTFVFTADYSLLNSAIATSNIIQYFIAAQDLASTPNVTASIIGFPAGYCAPTVALSAGALPMVTTSVKTVTVSTAVNPGLTTSVASICGSGTAILTSTGTTSSDPSITSVWESSPAGSTTWTVYTPKTAFLDTTPTLTLANDGIRYRTTLSCPSSSPVIAPDTITIAISNCQYNVTRNISPVYTYSSIITTGNTYSVLATADDAATNIIPLTNTTFKYFGQPVTSFFATTNGAMSFNTTTSTYYTTSTDLTSSSYPKTIAPYWSDLVLKGYTGATGTGLPNQNSCMRYKINGTLGSGNADIIIEWADMEGYNFGPPNLNFQVVLHEAGNTVEINYGNIQKYDGSANFTGTLANNISIGMNGGTPATASFNQRMILQRENTSFFTTTNTPSMLLTPECNSQYLFTPATAYTGGSAPTATPPSNDDIGSAISIPTNTSPCTSYCGTLYSSKNATASTGVSACTSPPAILGNADDDVWFTFNASNFTAFHKIVVTPSLGYNAAFQLFDASGNAVACKNDSLVGLTEKINSISLNNGAQYYIRIYDVAAGASASGEFSVCVSEVILPPSNDSFDFPIALTPSLTPFSTYSILPDATSGTLTQNIQTCNAGTPGNPDDDQWFKFTTATDSGVKYSIVVSGIARLGGGSSTYNPVVQLFKGLPSVANSSVTCVNATGNGGIETITTNTLSPFTDYYVRVYHQGSGAANGDFNISIKVDTPACVTPTSPINFSSVSTSVVSLAWTRVQGATSYDIYAGSSYPPTTLVVTQSGDSSTYQYTLPGFSTAIFYWKIVPKNSFITNNSCNRVDSFHNFPPCAATTTLASTNLTSTSVTANWNMSSSAPSSGYVYELRTSGGVGSGATGLVTSGTTASAIDTFVNLTGLTFGTTYSFYVKSNCGSITSGWSAARTIYIGYCNPAPSSVDGTGITLVNFGSTPNIVNNSTSTETNNYGNYSSQIGNIQAGVASDVNITYSTGYTYDTKIWIDFNNDLDFDDVGENVYTGVSIATSPTTLVASITIPPATTIGNYRMRIGGVDAGPPTTCYTGSYGTYEDYTVNVTAAPTCFPPILTATSGLTTSSVILNWTAPSNGTTPGGYEYVVSTTNTVPSGSGTAVSTLNATISSLSANTTYYYFVRSDCGSGTYSSWASGTFYTGYCIATSSSQASWISNFTSTGASTNMAFSSSAGAAGGYSDVSASNKISNYILSATSISLTAGGPTCGFAVWVDWNKNLVFEAGEKMFTTAGYVTTTTGTITVPSGTANGNYKMRVIVDFNQTAPASACGNISRGEYVDYNFEVVSAPTCFSPTINASTSVTLNTATINWAASASGNPAVTYEYVVSTTSGIPTSSGTSTSGTSVVLTSLPSNTTHYFYVRSVCGAGDTSSWNSGSFYTGYCSPPLVTLHSSASDLLTNVTIPTTTLNSSNGVSVTGLGFTAVPNSTPTNTALLGRNIPYTINTTFSSTPTQFSVWIDYNQNLIFDASEYTLGTISGTTGTISITPPLTATLGKTGMRIRVRGGTYTSADACLSFASGETEDYVIQIIDTCQIASSATLATSSQSGMVNQCVQDASGWSYYSPSGNPNALMFGINKGSSGMTGETISLELLSSIPASSSSTGINQENASYFMKRSWDVTGTVPTGSVSVRFFYDVADSISIDSARNADSIAMKIANPNSLLVKTPFKWFKSSGTPYNAAWRALVVGNKFPSSHVNLTPSSYGIINGVRYVEFSGITSFSGGSGGAGYGAPGAGGGVGLPVTWAGFDVTALETGNRLTWSTASEQNSDYFQVEYSYDAVNFITLAEKIKAAGTSNIVKSYTASHADFSTYVYYRIKQVDMDGRVDYSAVKSVKRTKLATFKVDVYPIPMDKSNTININVSSVDKSVLVMKMTDITGKVMKSKSYIPNTETITESFDMSNLSNGIYIIEVRNAQGIQSIKIVK